MARVTSLGLVGVVGGGLWALAGAGLHAQVPPGFQEAPFVAVPAPLVQLPIPFKRGEAIPTAARLRLIRLPPRPTAALQARVDQLLAATPAQRDAALAEYAAWWVDQYGASVPSAQKSLLVSEHVKFFRTATRLTQGPQPANGAAIRVGQQELAAAMTDLFLAERAALRSFPAAQEARYGRRVRYDLPVPRRAEILREITRFTTGSYMKEAAPAVPRALPSDSVHALQSVGQHGAFKVVAKRLPFADAPRPLPRFCADTSERTYSVVTERAAVGWVGYAFTGARSLLPSDWEAIGLPGIYHASILAGRWYLEKMVERVTSVKCTGAGARPLYSPRPRTTYTWRFHDWTVANGCGGKYLSLDEGDTLTLFKEFVPSSGATDPAEDVARQILGTTKDVNGKMCRARFGAYPQGPYGITWVCHQACNAFTHLKWGVDPVFYPISYPLYGNRGVFGVADVKAPCQCESTNANPCAVSGVGGACWLNTALGLADAWGDNLSSGFHFQNGWIDTQCKYKQEAAAAHVPGWDFEGIVIEG